MHSVCSAPHGCCFRKFVGRSRKGRAVRGHCSRKRMLTKMFWCHNMRILNGAHLNKFVLNER